MRILPAGWERRRHSPQSRYFFFPFKIVFLKDKIVLCSTLFKYIAGISYIRSSVSLKGFRRRQRGFRTCDSFRANHVFKYRDSYAKTSWLITRQTVGFVACVCVVSRALNQPPPPRGCDVSYRTYVQSRGLINLLMHFNWF